MWGAGRAAAIIPRFRGRSLCLAVLASGFILLPAPPTASGLEAILPVAAVALGGPAWTLNGPSTPVAVTMPPGTAFTAVSAGAVFSLAIDTQGDAWGWGRNLDGGLGNGTSSDSTVPVAVSMPAGVTFTQISAGAFGLALDSGGQAWAWGSNTFGQLGDGTTSNSSIPVAVSMPAGVTFTAVSAGFYHALAVDSAGGAWAWGRNDIGVPGLGLLGDGTQVDSTTPVPVALPAGVLAAQIAAAPDASVLLDTTGAAWAWGSNLAGQLGDGTNTSTLAPVATIMPANTSFTSVAAGQKFDIALDANGRAWGWGMDSSGQLGDGRMANSSLPVLVSMPAGVSFAAVAAGGDFGLALDQSGAAWAWGSGGSVPTAVAMPAGVRFAAISAGSRVGLAIQVTP